MADKKSKAMVVSKSDEDLDNRLDRANEYKEDKKKNIDWIIPKFNPEQLKELSEIDFIHQKAVDVKSKVIANGHTLVDADQQIKEIMNNSEIDDVIEKCIQDLEELGYFTFEVVRNLAGNIIKFQYVDAKPIRVAKDKPGYYKIKKTKKKYEKVHFWKKYGVEDNYNIKGNKQKATNYKKTAREMIFYSKRGIQENPYGLVDVVAAFKYIYLQDASAEHNISFFENDALPRALIRLIGSDIDDETENTVKEFFDNRFKGVKNKNKALLLSTPTENSKIEFDKIDDDNKQGDFIELSKLSRDFVITAEGVPPRLMSVVVGGQLGGSGETEGQVKIFKLIYVDPLKGKITKIFQKIFEHEGLKGTFKLADWDLKSLESTIKLYDKGIITLNEARKRIGYPETDKEDSIEALQMELAGIKNRLQRLIGNNYGVKND